MKYALNMLLTTVFTFVSAVTLACEVCQKQQPKILRGIAHGAGPQSNWDYVIVGGTAVLVLVSLLYGLKWIIKPGEKNSGHIKRSILDIN